MTVLGKTIRVKGELRAHEDLTIEGSCEGPIRCQGFAVVVGPSAQVAGDILARDITVLGRVVGQLVATEVVDVRAEATIVGHVVTGRFILDPAATFVGRVEPQHLEAALRVAEFQLRKRDVAAG